MGGHLADLCLEILESLVRLGRASTTSADGGLTSRTTSDTEGTGGTPGARGREGRDGGRRVYRAVGPSRGGIVSLSVVVGIPEPLHPLQELEVVP